MSTVNIKYGSNYHLYQSDGGYTIEFSDGNNLYSQKVNESGAGEAKIADYCAERVKLSFGGYLKRTRGTISIAEK